MTYSLRIVGALTHTSGVLGRGPTWRVLGQSRCALQARQRCVSRFKVSTDHVKNSVITTKIKTQLAADHSGSMKHISVDTDKNGIVWLTGTANNQAELDQAVTIARNTEGVNSVKSGCNNCRHSGRHALRAEYGQLRA